MNWWRAYHGLPNDPKLALVATVTPCNARRGEVLEVWVSLLDFASQNTPRGSIEGFDSEQIAWTVGLDLERVDAIIDAMRKKRMISGNSLTNWDKRQPKREREDDSLERVRAHRQRQKSRPEENVTPCNALEERRGEEKREEKEKPKRTRKKTEPMSVEQRLWFTEFLDLHPKRAYQTANAESLWSEKVKERPCFDFLMARLRVECAGDTTYLLGPWKWLRDHLALYANGVHSVEMHGVQPRLMFK